jgi:peptide/nickel transport system ATP-binding protein
VPGDLCETDVPEVKTLSDGHEIKCHLANDILKRMEPVISSVAAASRA